MKQLNVRLDDEYIELCSVICEVFPYDSLQSLVKRALMLAAHECESDAPYTGNSPLESHRVDSAANLVTRLKNIRIKQLKDEIKTPN